MKNKRSKSSIFYNSTKKKRRIQEQNQHLEEFYARKTADTEKYKDTRHKNGSFFYRNNNYERNTMSTAVGPFFIDDEPFARSDFTYKKDEPKRTYLYGFTNSKFIHFLGHLTPKEYLLFVTVIGLLIVEDRNETEAKILYAFISNVADTMQTLVEQEIILSKYQHNNEAVKLNNALHQDFETIYEELAKIKKKLQK